MENVWKELYNVPITHGSYKELLKDFMEFYMGNKQDSDVIVHMGLPVEAKLFIDAHNFGFIGDFDAPYPLIDISAIPEINVSVDTYNKEHSIEIPNCDGGTHNPLYDSWSALLAYIHFSNHDKNDSYVSAKNKMYEQLKNNNYIHVGSTGNGYREELEFNGGKFKLSKGTYYYAGGGTGSTTQLSEEEAVKWYMKNLK